LNISVVPYEPLLNRVVLRFIQNQFRTHYHLDWRPVTAWLREKTTLGLLAYNSPQALCGAMMLSPSRKGVSWIRLFSLRDGLSTDVFNLMLSQLLSLFPDAGIYEVGILETELWLRKLLDTSDFSLVDQLIHLKRSKDIPLAVSNNPISILPATETHLKAVEAIDHAAFSPYWQMQMDDLREVSQYASSFTIAVLDGQIVGYQLSTSYPDTIHLARLASSPSFQRKGIGSYLVQTLIQDFPHHHITVNTQGSNEVSQRLYKRLGFEQQHLITPVWNLVLQSKLEPFTT